MKKVGKCTHVGCRKAHHTDELKKNLSHRLNRIEGQVRAIHQMIDHDTYCDEVLNQITAVKSALDSVSIILLEAHVQSCVVDQLEQKEFDVIPELLKTIKKMIK